MDLVDLGEELSFLTSEDAAKRRNEIVTNLINAGTIEAKDLICSKEEFIGFDASQIKQKSYQNVYSLEALTCMVPTPMGLDKDALIEALKHKDPNVKRKVKRIAAWLIGASHNEYTENEKTKLSIALLNLLESSEDNLTLGKMAAWAIHKLKPSDPKTLKKLIKYLKHNNEYIIRRDILLAFLQSDIKDEEILSALEGVAKNDRDSIRSLL